MTLMKTGKRILYAAVGLVLSVSNVPVYSVEVDSYPELVSMVDQLVSEKVLDRQRLYFWLADARINKDILQAMYRPAERLPWYRYRPRFLTRSSIRNGEKFLTRYSDVFRRAETRFGIPVEILVAIIGIETRYGRVTGRHRVLDSLTTLALEYPRRSRFFLGQLEAFFRLSSEGILNPLETKGSYAGAIGIPQFMPSSYRHYAVDFDGDGRRDLIGSEADAIGSIAHYLNAHGWQDAEPVVERLTKSDGLQAGNYTTRGFKVDISLETLMQDGVRLSERKFTGRKVGVIRLEQDGYEEFRVAYPNFFVLTRYNRSQSYAMAVFELAEQIAKRKKDGG
jgi:membrane-bound lytic murein transglycosylase B